MTEHEKTTADKKPQRRKKRYILLKWLTVLFFLGVFAAAAVSTGIYLHFSKGLPSVVSLHDYRPPTVSTMYAADGTKIAEFFKERRIVIPLESMPRTLRMAFVSAEDARFFEHRGIDFISILRAFIKNLKAGGIVQGGSTITQQVTKSFFLSPERRYARKIREAILAHRIEKHLTKDEILYLYLNQIYLGHGAYGVEAAAHNYFGKHAKDLNLAESAILAGLPQAPSRYSPFHHPELAKERQVYVLNRMVAGGVITRQQADEALREQMDIRPRQNLFIEKAPYYTEHVRRYLIDKYGEDRLYNDGLTIRTAVDLSMQQAAGAAVKKGLRDLDKRQGYRGAIRNVGISGVEKAAAAIAKELEGIPLTPGIETRGIVIAVQDREKTVSVRFGDQIGTIAFATMRWARKPDPQVFYREGRIKHPGKALKVGDEIRIRLGEKAEDGTWQLHLEQTPKAQAALLCIEAGSGAVRAMIGGRDFRASQFNRAIQSRRQPGSAFKPFIYSAALDKGYSPASVIMDNAFVFKDAERDFKWKPKNYKGTFHGPTLLRTGLAKSRNVITIKVLQDIGLDYAIGYARKLGISSPINRDLSIALGSSGHSILEIVNAYAVFADGGNLTEPVFVTEVRDRNGVLLEKTDTLRERVIPASTAFLMTSLLESVVKSGTGWRAKPLLRKGWPVAGKTGTTNNLFDAWFVGYTPAYITGTWVGFDEEGSLGEGETGSRASAPIWIDFMEEIHKDKSPINFPAPPQDVITVKIDQKTGLLPIPESETVGFEFFRKGTEPTTYTPKPDRVEDKEDFFKMGI